MYSPVQKGIERTTQSVQYAEVKPLGNLSNLVHRFWEIKTDAVLSDNFCFHVLPDACVHIVFNLADPKTVGVTALRTTAEVLTLGKEFHFVGIRFLPGMWQGDLDEIVDGVIDAPYSGNLPLIHAGKALKNLNFLAQQPVLSELVQQLIDDEIVAVNAVTTKILTHIDSINTVADMAKITAMSPRQLQRTLKKMTGFSPHNLLKVLRLQQSFGQHYLTFYADQSHFIHSFRKATGYTPENYARKFGV